MEWKTEILPAVAHLALLGLKIRETAFWDILKKSYRMRHKSLVRFLYSDVHKLENMLECNYSEPSRFLDKSVSHACMNEHFWLKIYLASSHIEMKRSGIEMGAE